MVVPLKFNPTGYRVKKVLSQNPLYTSYLSVDLTTGKDCVLKTFTEEVPKLSELARFRLSHQIAVAIEHPNIAAVGDLQTFENRLFWAYEYLPFAPLKAILETWRIQERSGLLGRIFSPILDLVGYVHQRGYIYCDINPANFLFTDNLDRLLVAEFNSVVSHRGIIVYDWFAHNLGYLAPEQMGTTGQPMDFRADIYGLGVLFFQILTGFMPFPYKDPQRVADAHLTEVPINVSDSNSYISPHFDKVVATMLAKDPDARYQSIYGLRCDLQSLFDSLRGGNSHFAMDWQPRNAQLSAVFPAEKIRTVFSRDKGSLNLETASGCLAEVFPDAQNTQQAAEILFRKVGAAPEEWEKFLMIGYEQQIVAFSPSHGKWVFDLETMAESQVSDAVLGEFVGILQKFRDDVFYQVVAVYERAIPLAVLQAIFEGSPESFSVNDKLKEATALGVLISVERKRPGFRETLFKFAHPKFAGMILAGMTRDHTDDLELMVAQRIFDRFSYTGDMVDLELYLKHMNQVTVTRISKEQVERLLLDYRRLIDDYKRAGDFKKAYDWSQRRQTLVSSMLIEEQPDRWLHISFDHLDLALRAANYLGLLEISDVILTLELNQHERLAVHKIRALYHAAVGDLRSSNKEYLAACQSAGLATNEGISRTKKNEVFEEVIRYMETQNQQDFSDDRWFLDVARVFPNTAISFWMMGELEKGRAVAYLAATELMRQEKVCPDLLRLLSAVVLHYALETESIHNLIRPGKFLNSYLDGRVASGIFELCYVVNAMFAPYFSSWEKIAKTTEYYYQKAIFQGEVSSAGNLGVISWFWDKEQDLVLCNEKSLRKISVVREFDLKDAYQSMVMYHCFREALMGRTDEPTSMNHDLLDETAYIEDLTERRSVIAQSQFYLNKAILLYMYGQCESAFGLLEQWIPRIRQTTHFNNIEAAVYHLLAASALNVETENVRKSAGFLQGIAEACPERVGFLMKIYRGAVDLANGSYQSAIHQLIEAADTCAVLGQKRYQALALELATDAAMLGGNVACARFLSTETVRLYQDWGAFEKARDCFTKYQDVLPRVDFSRLFQSSKQSENINFQALSQGVQTISKEVHYYKLIRQLLRVLNNLIGATRTVFFRFEPATRAYRAICRACEQQEPTFRADTSEEASFQIPAEVLELLAVEQTGFVIQHAQKDPKFQESLHVKTHRTLALMVSPVISRGSKLGFVYFEHDRTPFFFNEDRGEMVQILLKQAAISIENAMIYEQMEQRIEERTNHLSEKTAALNSMLQNIHLGIFMVGRDFRIHAEYSEYLEILLGTTDIAGREILDLVFAQVAREDDTYSRVQSALTAILGEPEIAFQLNVHLLPREVIIHASPDQVRTVSIGWQPICQQEKVERLLVILRDDTELRSLQRRSEQDKREMETLGRVLKVGVDSAFGFLDRIDLQVTHILGLMHRGSAEEVLRILHTMKGTGRLMGFEGIAHICHRLEDTMQAGAQNDEQSFFAELEEQLSALGDHAGSYRSVLEKYFGSLQEQRAEKARALQEVSSIVRGDRASEEKLAAITALVSPYGNVSLQQALQPTIDALEEIAESLQKPLPSVNFSDPNRVLFSVDQKELLNDVFVHIFRNALDHGIESPEQRHSKGKCMEGTIDVRLDQTSKEIMIWVQDDGKGLDLPSLRRSSALPPSSPISDEQLAQLVFESGLSTAERITEISGRGVGMDVVKAYLQRNGGQISIVFDGPSDGEGFRPFLLKLRLPVDAA